MGYLTMGAIRSFAGLGAADPCASELAALEAARANLRAAMSGNGNADAAYAEVSRLNAAYRACQDGSGTAPAAGPSAQEAVDHANSVMREREMVTEFARARERMIGFTVDMRNASTEGAVASAWSGLLAVSKSINDRMRATGTRTDDRVAAVTQLIQNAVTTRDSRLAALRRPAPQAPRPTAPRSTPPRTTSSYDDDGEIRRSNSASSVKARILRTEGGGQLPLSIQAGQLPPWVPYAVAGVGTLAILAMVTSIVRGR